MGEWLVKLRGAGCIVGWWRRGFGAPGVGLGLLGHFLAEQPQAKGFPWLDLDFPICKMEVMAFSSSRSGGKG